MATEIVLVTTDDRHLLANTADGVFDGPISAIRWEEFLRDSRHHLAVAVDAGQVVGMATGVHYVHPDKEPELWINEVGVAPTHQKQGLGRRLLEALLTLGHRLGCTQAWVLTERGNAPAMRLYESCGGKESPHETVIFEFPLR
jgi:aminoglycoside 6'-N-acetyltransferase I